MLILDFPAGWYVLLFTGIALFLAFSYLRKTFSGCWKMGVVALAIALFVESVGIGTGLWTYATGNWPVILWPVYFVFGMTAYQALMIINGK